MIKEYPTNKFIYNRIDIFRTFKENENWLEKIALFNEKSRVTLP